VSSLRFYCCPGKGRGNAQACTRDSPNPRGGARNEPLYSPASKHRCRCSLKVSSRAIRVRSSSEGLFDTRQLSSRTEQSGEGPSPLLVLTCHQTNAPSPGTRGGKQLGVVPGLASTVGVRVQVQSSRGASG
jgi:hypothetical protein